MTGIKISELPVASTLTGAELIPVVQSGATDQTTVLAVANTVKPQFSANTGSSLVGFLPSGTGAVATTVQTQLRTVSPYAESAAKGNDKRLFANQLIVFCGDSTTEQGQVANRGGLYDRLLTFHGASGGPLEGIKGVVNYGMSGYKLTQFVNDAANPAFVGASAGNANWDFAGNKTFGYYGGVPLDDAVKIGGDIYVICYGINDLILTTTGTGSQTDMETYLIGLLNTAVDRLRTALPRARIVLRPPNPMTSRPYNPANGFPSPTIYPTFGSNGAVDSALVTTWNAALYNAYRTVAQTNRFVDFLDVWNMVAYNWDPATVPANQNPYAWDLVHPNNAGYKAVADGLVLLLTGTRFGYSQPRATQAEGMVTYFGQTAIEYYNYYPEGPNYIKLFEAPGTVTATYIDIDVPLSKFLSILNGITSLSFRLANKSSGTISFSLANVTDPTGGGTTTRISSITVAASKVGTGVVALYQDKVSIPGSIVTRSSGTLSVVVSAGTGNSTFTIPTAGTYIVTLNARAGDYNHARLGTYFITFDDASTNDFTSTQLIGSQITKGASAPTALSCTVTNVGVVTVTISASNTTWPVDYTYSRLA